MIGKMKKAYITPELDLTQVEAVTLLAGSPDGTHKTNVGAEGTDESDDGVYDPSNRGGLIDDEDDDEGGTNIWNSFNN